MTGPRISDEMLMGFADGTLSEADCAQVEAALAEDPALADRLAPFLETGPLLAAAAAARPLDPPPGFEARMTDRLAALKAEEAAAKIVPLPRRAPRGPIAIAASVALLAGLVLGAAVPLALRPVPGAGLPGGVVAALDNLPSGESRALGDEELHLIASFEDGAGTFCREYELRGAQGSVNIACRGADGWQSRLSLATGDSEGGYMPASTFEPLDAWLAAAGAGQPLSAEAEQAALSARD